MCILSDTYPATGQIENEDKVINHFSNLQDCICSPLKMHQYHLELISSQNSLQQL